MERTGGGGGWGEDESCKAVHAPPANIDKRVTPSIGRYRPTCRGLKLGLEVLFFTL